MTTSSDVVVATIAIATVLFIYDSVYIFNSIPKICTFVGVANVLTMITFIKLVGMDLVK